MSANVSISDGVGKHSLLGPQSSRLSRSDDFLGAAEAAGPGPPHLRTTGLTPSTSLQFPLPLP